MENLLKKLTKSELLEFIGHYDSYIQDANDKDSYKDGWRPVCANEFYDNEYQEILQEGIRMDRENNK